MKIWKARIKEKGTKRILTPEYIFFNTGEKTEKEMIQHWGLDGDDVEWYELWLEKENEQ